MIILWSYCRWRCRNLAAQTDSGFQSMQRYIVQTLSMMPSSLLILFAISPKSVCTSPICCNIWTRLAYLTLRNACAVAPTPVSGYIYHFIIYRAQCVLAVPWWTRLAYLTLRNACAVAPTPVSGYIYHFIIYRAQCVLAVPRNSTCPQFDKQALFQSVPTPPILKKWTFYRRHIWQELTSTFPFALFELDSLPISSAPR
jgi:hypothetical protein